MSDETQPDAETPKTAVMTDLSEATASPYKEFERLAVEAGASAELAHAMYNVVRDSQEHDWMKPVREWVGDGSPLIARALDNPQKMAEACLLLFASDGLMYDEGQLNAGISDAKRREIEAYIFNR